MDGSVEGTRRRGLPGARLPASRPHGGGRLGHADARASAGRSVGPRAVTGRGQDEAAGAFVVDVDAVPVLDDEEDPPPGDPDPDDAGALDDEDVVEEEDDEVDDFAPDDRASLR